jgi:hypothetical protein
MIMIGSQKKFPNRDLLFHLIIYSFNLYPGLLLFGTDGLMWPFRSKAAAIHSSRFRAREIEYVRYWKCMDFKIWKFQEEN